MVIVPAACRYSSILARFRFVGGVGALCSASRVVEEISAQPCGTGFWHETYFMRGGVEAVFDDVPRPIGLIRFADRIPASGSMFTARQRAHTAGAAGFAAEAPLLPAVAEDELDGSAAK